MRGGRRIIVGIVIAIAARAADAATVVIDDFTSATTNGMANPAFGCTPGMGPGTCFITDMNVAQGSIGSIVVTDGPLADVLGGTRQLTVTADSLQMVPPPDLVVAGVVPIVGFLDYNSTAQADGRIALLYDGGGMGLGPVFTSPEGVRVIFLDADDAAVSCPNPPMACTAGYDVEVTVVDGAMHSAAAKVTILIPGPATLSFPFTSFKGIGAVNLADIFSIKVAIDPNTAGDMRLGRIEVFENTVPRHPVPTLSPVSLLLLIASLLYCSRHLRSRSVVS